MISKALAGEPGEGVSEAGSNEAFVWVWLPDATQPVVAGRLARSGGQLVFNYGRSYLERPDAISLYEPELPLRAGALPVSLRQRTTP